MQTGRIVSKKRREGDTFFGSNSHQQNYLVKKNILYKKNYFPPGHTTHIHHILLCRNKIKDQSQIMNNKKNKRYASLFYSVAWKTANTSLVLLNGTLNVQNECTPTISF